MRPIVPKGSFKREEAPLNPPSEKHEEKHTPSVISHYAPKEIADLVNKTKVVSENGAGGKGSFNRGHAVASTAASSAGNSIASSSSTSTKSPASSIATSRSTSPTSRKPFTPLETGDGENGTEAADNVEQSEAAAVESRVSKWATREPATAFQRTGGMMYKAPTINFLPKTKTESALKAPTKDDKAPSGAGLAKSLAAKFDAQARETEGVPKPSPQVALAVSRVKSASFPVKSTPAATVPSPSESKPALRQAQQLRDTSVPLPAQPPAKSFAASTWLAALQEKRQTSAEPPGTAVTTPAPVPAPKPAPLVAKPDPSPAAPTPLKPAAPAPAPSPASTPTPTAALAQKPPGLPSSSSGSSLKGPTPLTIPPPQPKPQPSPPAVTPKTPAAFSPSPKTPTPTPSPKATTATAATPAPSRPAAPPAASKPSAAPSPAKRPASAASKAAPGASNTAAEARRQAAAVKIQAQMRAVLAKNEAIRIIEQKILDFEKKEQERAKPRTNAQPPAAAPAAAPRQRTTAEQPQSAAADKRAKTAASAAPPPGACSKPKGPPPGASLKSPPPGATVKAPPPGATPKQPVPPGASAPAAASVKPPVAATAPAPAAPARAAAAAAVRGTESKGAAGSSTASGSGAGFSVQQSIERVDPKWRLRVEALQHGCALTKVTLSDGAKQHKWLRVSSDSATLKYSNKPNDINPTTVRVKELVNVLHGSQSNVPSALPGAQPWLCFSVFDDKKSYDFIAPSDDLLINTVLAIQALIAQHHPIALLSEHDLLARKP